MLRFVVKFDLTTIFRKISCLSPGNDNLDFESANVALVGHERTGKVLLSHHGYNNAQEMVSCISLYDPKTLELTELYLHKSLMKCVSASVPWDNSLLALIIQTPTRNSRNGYEFQSIVVDLRTGRIHEFETFNNKVQRIQFLYTTKAGRYYLLLFVEKHSVQRWKIRVNSSINDLRLNITYQKDIAKDFFWYEWERHKNQLFVLQKSISRSPSLDKISKKCSTGVYHCFLKCIHFTEAEKTEILWEIPLTLSLPNTVADKRLYFAKDHRARLPSSRHFSIIHLNANAICLCQQHPVTSKFASTIQVTIFVLHMRYKLDITIPMNNCDYETIANTRVFFGPFGSVLLIYIPGIFIELVDCGAHHEVFPGVMLTQSDLIGDLPKRTTNETSCLVRFPTITDPLEMKGNCFYDANHGTCYEYLIHYPTYLEIFKQCPDYIHKPAVHIAIVYIQDDDLLNEILRIICLQYPFYIAPLLCEVLTCLVYEKAKSQHSAQSGFVSLIPSTSLRPLAEEQNQNRLEIVATRLNGYYVYPGGRLIIKDVKQPRLVPKFRHTKLYEAKLARNASPTKFTIWAKGLLQKSTKVSIDGVENLLTHTDLESSLNKGCGHMIVNFSIHASNVFPTKVKEDVNMISQLYRFVVTDQANLVFSKIAEILELRKQKTKAEAKQAYQVLESFYSALEELHFPCPRGFSHMFVEFGNKCLPRSVFLQYIERGIFLLNVEFVEGIIQKLDSSCEEDKLFKYELLSHLHQREESLRIMQYHEEYVEYLLQYHLSQIPLNSLSRNDQPANLESTSKTPFIPRSLFLNAIRERYGTDNLEHQAVIALVESNSDLLYTKIVSVAEFVASANDTLQIL